MAHAETDVVHCCGPEGCGLVRMRNPGLVSPDDMGRTERLCIGSKCMAWRKTGQVGRGPNGERRDRDMDGRTQWIDTGYCGLAGPEAKCAS